MAEEIEAAAAGEAELPDERLALMFACAHPAHRPRHPRAADPADHPRLRRRRHRLGLPRLARHAWASAWCAPSARSGRPASRSRCPRARSSRRVSTPCSRPSTPPSPKAGRIPPAPRRAAATSPRKGSGWAGSSSSLLPDEPEALGLLSLMLHAQARRDARRDAQGEYVPLADQDPAAWDAQLIEEAEALLSRASALPGTGRYQLEAAVQSAHVVRRRTGRSDWAAIERIYDALLAMTGSPVVAINRAIAVAETRGAAAGLAALDALADDRRLARLPALLGRACRTAGADGRRRSRRCSLRAGDRPGARSRRAPLPAAAPRGAARGARGVAGASPAAPPAAAHPWAPPGSMQSDEPSEVRQARGRTRRRARAAARARGRCA